MMEKVKIVTEYIKLDQFLKFAGICQAGSEAKMKIADNSVVVNGTIERQRGKKLRNGDIVEVDGRKIEVQENSLR